MRHILESLLSGKDLTENEAQGLYRNLIDPAQPREAVAAILAALRAKGEKGPEIRGFAEGMRRAAARPAIDTRDCIDIVGTGGDGSRSLNLSTGVALLTAACGMPVVKHGNRSISSLSGSADVLEALGFRIQMDELEAGSAFAETGFTFLFAPRYHPAMASIGPVRSALGVRTIFNLVGPLTNPVRPKYNLIGALSTEVALLLADALSGMDVKRAFVVHGAEGWDEPTPVGPFELYDVEPHRIRASVRDPSDYGLAACDAADLRGRGPAYNASAIESVFAGARGPHRDALLLGAGLALELSGRATSPDEGIQFARNVIDSGRAAAFIDQIRACSGALGVANDV